MLSRTRTCFAVSTAALLALAGPCAAQNSRTRTTRPKTKAAAEWKPVGPAQVALSQRVTTYYQDIEKDQRAAALDLVAPESRNAYFHQTPTKQVGYHIERVQIAKDGRTATVVGLRSLSVAGFPEPMDFRTRDTWKMVNGRWCIELPSSSEAALRPGQKPVTPEQIRERMKEAQKDIDPAEYLYALEKVKATQKQAEKSAKNPPKKPAQKQPADQKKTGQNSSPKPQSPSR